VSCSTRSGSATGGGLSSATRSALKTTAFAPMPAASVRTATAELPGVRRSGRHASRRNRIVGLITAAGTKPRASLGTGAKPRAPIN
jgi:hypothetical protein